MSGSTVDSQLRLLTGCVEDLISKHVPIEATRTCHTSDAPVVMVAHRPEGLNGTPIIKQGGRNRTVQAHHMGCRVRWLEAVKS